MLAINGIEATKLIRATYPEVKIVILSSITEQELIKDTLIAGATSYISKTGSIDEVTNTVKKAYMGEAYLDVLAINALISLQTHPVKGEHWS